MHIFLFLHPAANMLLQLNSARLAERAIVPVNFYRQAQCENKS